MSKRINRSFVPFDNHETPVTEAARVNAEKIAARRNGLSVYTVARVAGLALALAAAYRLLFA